MLSKGEEHGSTHYWCGISRTGKGCTRVAPSHHDVASCCGGSVALQETGTSHLVVLLLGPRACLVHVCKSKILEWVMGKNWDARAFSNTTSMTCIGAVCPRCELYTWRPNQKSKGTKLNANAGQIAMMWPLCLCMCVLKSATSLHEKGQCTKFAQEFSCACLSCIFAQMHQAIVQIRGVGNTKVHLHGCLCDWGDPWKCQVSPVSWMGWLCWMVQVCIKLKAPHGVSGTGWEMNPK